MLLLNAGKDIVPLSRMTTAIKSEKPASAAQVKSSALAPELKVFIDRVIIPTLVKKYLEERPRENVLAVTVKQIDNRDRKVPSFERGKE
jgi:hypothetical protein